MASGDLKFKQLVWLVRLLNKNKGGLTHDDIDSHWKKCPYNERNGKLTISTFHNYCRDIESWFDIKVICKKKGMSYFYYLGDTSDLVKDRLTDAILNGFILQGRLLETPSLSGCITVRPQPKSANLEKILDAIESHRRIRVVRRKPHLDQGLLPLLKPIEENHPGIIDRTYGGERQVVLEVEPLSIDMTGKGNLVSRTKGKKKTCIVALNNIKDIEILEEEFEFPENTRLGIFGGLPIFARSNDTPDDRLIFYLEKCLEKD